MPRPRMRACKVAEGHLAASLLDRLRNPLKNLSALLRPYFHHGRNYKAPLLHPFYVAPPLRIGFVAILSLKLGNRIRIMKTPR